MRHCIAAIFFLCALNSQVNAQNLVPNPSFEEYVECPFVELPAVSEISKATDWFTPTCSSDWFHSCSLSSWWQVPENIEGNQMSKAGNGYAGIVINSNGAGQVDPNWREYLSVELLSTLEKDSFYRVSMYVSLAENSGFACDCVSVLFTSDSIEVDVNCLALEAPMITATPQLETPAGYFLQDTAEWMELCWIYQANGTENFITIGNYKESAMTNLIEV